MTSSVAETANIISVKVSLTDPDLGWFLLLSLELANSCNLFVSKMGIDTPLAELTLPLTL